MLVLTHLQQISWHIFYFFSLKSMVTFFITLRVWPHEFLRINVQGKFCWWLLSSHGKSRLSHHLPKSLQVYSIWISPAWCKQKQKEILECMCPLERSCSVSCILCQMNALLWIAAKHSCEAEFLGYGVSNTAGMELIPFWERW